MAGLRVRTVVVAKRAAVAKRRRSRSATAKVAKDTLVGSHGRGRQRTVNAPKGW